MRTIGMKLAIFNNKHDVKSYEVVQVDPVKAQKLSLTAGELDNFIANWEGACQKHSINEILAMMLHVYKTSEKQKRKMERVFKSFPAVGLLNVAVRSIKFGEMKTRIEEFNGHVYSKASAAAHTEMVDAEPSIKDVASENENCIKKPEKSVLGCFANISADDIIKYIVKYFESDHCVPRKYDPSTEERLVVPDCEIWLSAQFSVKEFECLGHGSFFAFLEKYASHFPTKLRHLLTEGSCHKSTLKASMLEKQFLVLLLQATRYLGDRSVLTIQFLSLLFKKQFPTISFQIKGNDPDARILDLVKNQKDIDVCSSVVFSMALLGSCNQRIAHKLPEESFKTKCELVGPLGSVSEKDAIECLLRAPKLSDLQAWSHWDLVFAPSLGPLLDWLLNIGGIEGLSCIVTSDGRIIRIDHSATPDEFLEASIQGSSLQAAVKLLSLLFAYGGSQSIPVSLLKCYCQRAFDVMIKNCTTHCETSGFREILVQRSSSQRQFVHDADDDCAGRGHCMSAELEGGHLCQDISQLKKAYGVVAIFIRDCLGYLPSEFRSAAAEILVTVLQGFTKDASFIILSVCKLTNERVMLHDIALSLGIVEWIEDYQAFISATVADLPASSPSLSSQSQQHNVEHDTCLKSTSDISRTSVDGENEADFVANSIESDSYQKEFCDVVKTSMSTEETSDKIGHYSFTSKDNQVQDAALLIKTIRCEEFGLDSDLANAESGLLTKQHARLGRALHCLSQELYSHDSHFILELVQNADDNNYPEHVEPTLAFILLPTGVVVMNNEHGFSAQNIRALCDVGSSTKKGSSAGYIGKKGIGFKSVFRVTDAPEIHSNGFHVKFDITDGQIGFVLPTIVSPCNIDFFEKQLSYEYYESNAILWNTCIVLPFNSRIKQAMGISPIISMFSDLHPSLLLFLNRLQCIKFRNMLDNKLVTMRRHILGDGIIKISRGDEEMNWLVVSKDLRASTIRPDVQNTKIAIAFTLQESDNGRYTAVLGQQPVFAFLPLRKYGLKFILQGDFVLPSSREEVDGDDAWNQWLLSEFPDLFVSSEKYFCALSCFKESPGKAVTAFMSFVPLMGEVHGFFSHLPHLIMSRLRLSNCLLLDGPNIEWAPPCRVLRNWNEQAHTFLPDALLQQHLGLGYLSKDIVLSDALAKALGIQEYGPTFLVGLLSSICSCGGVKLLGLSWLSFFLDALYTYSNSMYVHSSGYLSSAEVGNESDFTDRLREISFIPLSDGSYNSLASGPIWLPCDAFSCKFAGGDSFKNFPALLAKLRTVTPLLFSADTSKTDGLGESKVDNLTRMLLKIGVRQLSSHDIIQIHIMLFISAGRPTRRDVDMMVECLSFIMAHFQSACSNCKTERADLILRLQKKPTVITNHGFKCLVEEPIHFSKEFGNFIDINKLIDSQDIKWNEIDSIYLKHHSSQSSSFGLTKWREFFQELGVTDFVQVKNNEKNIADIISTTVGGIPSFRDILQRELWVTDWESPELDRLLLTISENNCLDKSKYLLEVLDRMWDDYFWEKVNCYSLQNKDEITPFESSFIKNIRSFKWVASSIDKEVHCPTDLFYDCEPVHLILGDFAPYAVPKVCSKRFLNDIGFRIQVTLDDSLKVLQYWIYSSTPSASISQMSKLYTFIRDGLASSTEKIIEVRSCISVFVPLISKHGEMDVVPGLFLPPEKIYWHDPTGCLNKLTETGQINNLESENNVPICVTLDNLYPGLHDFFVTACGVLETPPFHSYLQILLQLSRKTSPSQSAHQVFQVLLRFLDDLKSGILTFEEFCGLKESLLKLENTVLPTVQDKWVSLNSRFGLICWSDDEELMEQYVHLNDVYFLQFGKLTALEKEMLSEKVSSLMRMIGIRSLTEVVSREPIFYGIADSKETSSLIHWALPYVQRYLYQLHPDTYLHLMQNEFETLRQLQVIGVETLFYRFSLNGYCGTNMKRYECSCLLQGNILYITPYVDSHSTFLELSRLFFQGNPDLQMANFLHIITSMVESSTPEQIESFVAKTQKIAELPAGQTLWCISSLLTANEICSPVCSSPMIANRVKLNQAKKRFTKLNWPPTNWKFSPDLHSASMMHVREKPGPAPAESKQKNSCRDPSNIMHSEDIRVPTESDEKGFTKDNSIAITPISKGTSKVGQKQTEHPGFIEKGIVSCSETGRGPAHSTVEPSTELGMTCLSPIIPRDILCLGIPEEEQSYKTGRVGEIIAYRYFSEKLGSTEAVRWVNEQSETGLPYDLIIDESGNTEYIEVKSTTSASKDWFPISPNEFHYASEKGDSYSIARVILSSPTNADIFVLRNPLKLCQQNVLQLALLVPHGSENSTM